jgi:hypothetical protein
VADLDAYADELARIGLDVAVRIRDESPDTVVCALHGLDVQQLRHLVLILAAHVPVDLPASVLTGWWTHPQQPPPPAAVDAAAQCVVDEWRRVNA